MRVELLFEGVYHLPPSIDYDLWLSWKVYRKNTHNTTHAQTHNTHTIPSSPFDCGVFENVYKHTQKHTNKHTQNKTNFCVRSKVSRGGSGETSVSKPEGGKVEFHDHVRFKAYFKARAFDQGGYEPKVRAD